MQNETHQILVNKYCAVCTVANITVGTHWGILINTNVVLYKNILNKTILGKTNPKNLRKKTISWQKRQEEKSNCNSN